MYSTQQYVMGFHGHGNLSRESSILRAFVHARVADVLARLLGFTVTTYTQQTIQVSKQPTLHTVLITSYHASETTPKS